MKVELQRVHYMPKELKPGVLYVSEEFGTAAHLCACGCGSKIRTPLGPAEWTLEMSSSGPTLRPSIGNWQQACRSHYWIYRGGIKWADQWTPEQIAADRQNEKSRRKAYFDDLKRKRGGLLARLWRWIKGLFA